VLYQLSYMGDPDAHHMPGRNDKTP